MNKNETILLGAACFFAGAVAGFLIAPIKKGIYCGEGMVYRFPAERFWICKVEVRICSFSGIRDI